MRFSGFKWLVCIGLLTTPVLVEAAMLSLSPSSESVVVGDTFSVDIILNASESVDGVDIHYLNYPSGLLEVQDSDGSLGGTQITSGVLMGNTIFNQVDIINGQIAFSQTTAGGLTYSGSGVLASITFQALAAGTADVSFDFTLNATTDTNVAADAIDVLNSVIDGSYAITNLIPPETLSVSLSASPSSGTTPLNDVDLTAIVTGTASGTINYKFDCTDDSVWDLEVDNNSSNPYTAIDVCDYAQAGDYTVRIYVERDTANPANDAIPIVVSSSPPPIVDPPIVDLQINDSDGPVTIDYGDSVILSWDSENADICDASVDWNGLKPLYGSETLSNLISSKTYTLTCTNAEDSVSDSVVVNVSDQPVDDGNGGGTSGGGTSGGGSSGGGFPLTEDDDLDDGDDTTQEDDSINGQISNGNGAGLDSEESTSTMTIEELKAEIARIQALIVQLLAKLALLKGEGVYEGIPAGFVFNKNLWYGMESSEVKYLQIILRKEIGSPIYPEHVPVTGWFGPTTRAAVIKFQERYASDILAPYGLYNGTGYAGQTTRTKLNQLLSP